MRLRSAKDWISVLGRLDRDGVRDTVLGIEPVGRRGLGASAQRHEQVSGDVALRVADLLEPWPVDGDEEAGRVEGLLDAQVDEARHAAHAVEEPLREGAIPGEVVPDDLHVDRRRQAEVEDLADDVHGRK